MRLMQSAGAFNPVNLHWVLISHANIPLMQSVMRNRKLLVQTGLLPLHGSPSPSPSPFSFPLFPLPSFLHSDERVRDACPAFDPGFQLDAFPPCFRFARRIIIIVCACIHVYRWNFQWISLWIEKFSEFLKIFFDSFRIQHIKLDI